MFRITGGKGFHMTFANGWTISVQWGPGNYCDNHDDDLSQEGYRTSGNKGSTTAECAVWPEDGEMLEMPNGDTVVGYLKPDEVLALMVETSKR